MAKKFNFRFAALERMRELVEKNRKREFGIAMEKMNQLNAQYKELGEARYTSMQDLKPQQVGTLDMDSVLSSRAWVAHLSVEGAKKQNEMRAQQEIINQCRNELLQATRDCKVMEKLNERDKTIWQKEVEIEEQKLLDDTPKSSLLNDDTGNISQIILMIMAMASLALIVVIGALFAFNYLSPKKVKQIQWILTNQGQFLNQEQLDVYAKSEENKKKYTELFNKQKIATDGLAVNKSFDAQEKLLEKKRQSLFEIEKRLRVIRAEIENEKNRISAMQDQVIAKIKDFNQRRKKAEDFAKSEGIQKAIKIFNNMDPATISNTLTKGKNPKGNVLTETTTYLKLMREDLAAEVISAMSLPWQQAIKDELNRIPIVEKK